MPFDPVVLHRLQVSLDLSQLGAHARSDWLPPEDEAAAIPTVRAVMREAEKVERLRIAEASSASVRNREPPELKEPRLVGMKGEPEACEPHLEVCKELLCFVPVLEADDGVIRIADDNYVAFGGSLSPVLDPEIVDVVKIDVRQQRTNDSALRRPLFRHNHLAIFEHPSC